MKASIYWLICYLDQLGPVGASGLVPYKTLLSVSAGCLICSAWAKSFVRDRHKQNTQIHSAGTDTDSRDRQRTENTEREADYPNRDSLSVQCLQGEMLFFLSLMRQQCITGNMKPITQVFNPCRTKLGNSDREIGSYHSQGRKSGKPICVNYCVILIQSRATWEEGPSAEGLSPLGWMECGQVCAPEL